MAHLLVHEFFATELIFFVLPLVLKLHNAGRRKQSLQFLDSLGEYKILPLFLPSQKLPKTHECHHGWKATTGVGGCHLHLWVHVMGVAPTLPIVTWAG